MRPAAPRRATRVVALMVVLAACANPVSPSPSVAPPTPSPTPSPSPSPSPTPPPPTPSPTPELDQGLLARRFTLLILGKDSNVSRESGGAYVWRTDSIMVVSVSADQSTVTFLSLPRDTVDVPLEGGGVYRGKINGLSIARGLDAMRGAMSTLLGVPIDGYVAIDMDDFAELVDAVRGVTINVPVAISDPKVHISLRAGWQHLTGAEALAWARTRVDSDYGRAARQQLLVAALARKYASPGTVFDLPRLLLALDSLQTDLDLTQLPTLLEIARRASDAQVVGTVLSPPRFARFWGVEPNSSRGWIIIPNVPAIRSYAQSLLLD